MALQRFKEVFLVALILGCINTAGVNSAELNSTNFASSTEVTTKANEHRAAHTDTPSTVLAPKLSLSETTDTKANLTEARITSITFRSEEADVDKENDETISFGIRSFTVEIATPATEKPIPLNEKVGAASKINVQQAAASSLPILTLESDQDRNDKVSDDERTKVFVAQPSDTLTPKATEHTNNKQENIDATVATPIDASEKDSINIHKSNNSPVDGAHLQSVTTIGPVKLTSNSDQSSVGNNNEHEQLSISSNGMHVEQKLENGLYRIKIAEIITDEFNNGHLNSDTKQMFDEKQKLNKNDDLMHSPAFTAPQPSGQINIADLYPSKLEDFSSIIRESNEKLIEEKNRYVGLEKGNGADQPIISDARFSIIDDDNEQENSIQFGNEGDASVDHEKQTSQQQQQHAKVNGAFNSIENNIPTTKIEIELIDEPGASKDDVKIIGPGDDDDYVSPVERVNGPNNDKVTDFTSELQLKDDMVSKIEQSFRESSMTNMQQQLQGQQPITINHPINPMGFIERRVKKFDPSFRKRFMPYDGNMNRESSLPAAANAKSIDENIISQSDEERKLDANIPNAKFYHAKDDGTNSETTTVNPNKIVANKQTNNNANTSKSQTADKKNNKADDLIEHESNEKSTVATVKKDSILSTPKPINSTERKILFFNVNGGINNTIDKNELKRMQKDREQIIKESHLTANTSATETNRTAGISTNMHLYIIHNDPIGQKPSESIKTNYSNANKESPIAQSSIASASATTPASILPEAHPSASVVTLTSTTSKEPSAAPALIDAISSTESNSDKHSSSLNSIKSITQSPNAVPAAVATTSTAAPLSTTTMQTKSRAMNSPLKQKPFGRRGFDGFYFETECDMQTPLPTDSTVWRGNETHELNLPTTVSQFLFKLFTYVCSTDFIATLHVQFKIENFPIRVFI